MNCPKCNGNKTRTASKLAYREGVYFCLECAIYFPSKKLEKILEKEKTISKCCGEYFVKKFDQVGTCKKDECTISYLICGECEAVQE